MNEFLTTSQAAAGLGVSERRVRTMIERGQLPAQRLLGRWAVPVTAVVEHSLRPAAGRPMSESSAWTLLRFLSGTVVEQSPTTRIRQRIRSLVDTADPVVKLMSWVARRGVPVRVWGTPAALSALESDERAVVSGDRAVHDIQQCPSVRVYVSASDVDDVIRDHALHRVEDGRRIPNITLWSVTDLGAVPRSPSNPHLAAAPVAAIDLLDGGDTRAAAVARRIISPAVGMLESFYVAQPPLVEHRGTSARHRPHVVVKDLKSLRGPTDSVVRLPILLDWGPNPVYDLSIDTELRSFYERVLNEALHVEQLETFLNKDLLVELWPSLWPARDVRDLWEERFPELVARAGTAGRLM